MNKLNSILSIGCIFIIGLVVSCGHSASEIADIVSERDSLRQISKRQERQINNLDELVQIVNGSLDSIASQEGMLFVTSKNEDGRVSKEDILNNISRLEELISSQKVRINNLESRLAEQEKIGDVSYTNNRLKDILENMRRQLEQKDAQIASLKAELGKKDVDLAKLRAQSDQQARTIIELDKRATMQQEALKRQDAMLNQCYMAIASKKELEQRGIIKKGKVVAQNALDRSKFSKVDIRKLTEITFSAKKPKLLTPMPDNAYELTTDGNHNFTLKISNPTAFWSVSNYLIIQTN